MPSAWDSLHQLRQPPWVQLYYMTIDLRTAPVTSFADI